MLTAEDVRAVEFGRSTRGYKQSDVDVFLEEVASAMEALMRERTDYENKLRTLNRKIEEYQEAEGSIHTTLLNAQRMADQTVKEAGESAGRVTSEATRKAQQLVEQAEEEAAALRKAAEEEITARMNDAIAKSESIISAAHDSVARQQLLFDKLKAEAAAFKNLMIPKFEDLLSLMQKLPAEVPFGPERAAEALSFAYDKLPDYAAMAAAAKPAPAAKTEEPNTAPVPQAKPAGPGKAPQAAPARPAAPAAQPSGQPEMSRRPDQPAQPAQSAAPGRPAPAAPASAPTAGQPSAGQSLGKKRPALQKSEIEAGRELGQSVLQPPAQQGAPKRPASASQPMSPPAPQKGGFKIMVEDDDDEDMLGGLFEEDFEEEKPRRGFFKKKK